MCWYMLSSTLWTRYRYPSLSGTSLEEIVGSGKGNGGTTQSAPMRARGSWAASCTKVSIADRRLKCLGLPVWSNELLTVPSLQGDVFAAEQKCRGQKVSSSFLNAPSWRVLAGLEADLRYFWTRFHLWSFFLSSSVLAGHCWVHSLLTILRLHRPYGPVLLAPHWHHWLLCSLHVCPEDLRRSENRLKMHRPSRKQTLLNTCPPGSEEDVFSQCFRGNKTQWESDKRNK